MSTTTALFPAGIETERLRLERIGPDTVDVRELYRTFWTTDHADAVFEHVPQDVHDHPKATAAFVADAAEYWAAGEGAQWVVRPKAGEDDAGRPAGVTSLGVDWDCRRAGIGLLLDEPYWGRGYSGERAAALMALAFEHLDLEVVTVDHTVDNENSRRAVERYVDRFGGQRDGVVRNDQPREEVVDDVVRYSVTADQWAAHRPTDHHLEVHDEP